MNEMVERVAMAAAEAYHGRPVERDYVFGAATGGHIFVEIAHAAIEAMREPGPGMYGAGGIAQFRADFAQTPVREAVGNVYRAMIDAALDSAQSVRDSVQGSEGIENSDRLIR